MGEVGKLYPKPLWPLFDTHLMELQCSFLEQYGVENYIINTHFLSDTIEKKLENYTRYPIKRIFEEPLLGSGGCFLNIKEKEEHIKKVVILNADIQIFLSARDQVRLNKEFDEHDSVMVCLPVDKDSGYNKVNFDENSYFKSVTKPSKESTYYTYSGFGLVNLSLLKGAVRTCGFFDAIVNNRFFKTKIFIPEDKYEYWDWGTLELYLSNIIKLTETGESKLKSYLIDNEFIDLKKLGNDSYFHPRKKVYNFTKEILKGNELDAGVYFRDHFDKLLKIKF
jgi:NDP-sugar pyrophosphorylase family protein